MSAAPEVIAAELVWRYVELVREQPEGVLSPEELQRLAAALETASALPGALEVEEARGCRAAVRRRVESLVERAPRVPVPGTARSESDRPGRRLVPVWRFYAAACMAAAALTGVITVGWWHRPPVVVHRVPAAAPDVQPLDEPRAHELITRLVREGIEPQDERNLMWHMLLCPGCYEQYVSLRRPPRVARLLPAGWQPGQE